MSLIEHLQPLLAVVGYQRELEYELNMAQVPPDVDAKLAAAGFVFVDERMLYDRIFKGKVSGAKLRVRQPEQNGARLERELTLKRRLKHPTFKAAEEWQIELSSAQLRQMLTKLGSDPSIKVENKYRLRRTWIVPDSQLKAHVDCYADGFRTGEIDCSDPVVLESWVKQYGDNLMLTSLHTSALRRDWSVLVD